MNASVTDEERETLRRYVRTLDALAFDRPLPAHVYLVITPLGMRSRGVLAGALSALGIRVNARVSLRDWPRLSTALQVKRRDASALARAVWFERTWCTLFPEGLAEAWRLDGGAHRVLVEHKARLRAILPNLPIAIRGERASLHAFHLADPGWGPREARWLEVAMALLRAPSNRAAKRTAARAATTCFSSHSALAEVTDEGTAD